MVLYEIFDLGSQGVKDKQAVWREQIGLGQKKRTTSAKPTFNVSGRFVQEGVGFSRALGNEDGDAESAIDVYNDILEYIQEQRDTPENSIIEGLSLIHI